MAIKRASADAERRYAMIKMVIDATDSIYTYSVAVTYRTRLIVDVFSPCHELRYFR